MPITKKKDGYYWGSKGPFKTRKKAAEVAQAAYASGYVKKGWKNILKADPKKGTGKKPKGSKRRLFVDENPKDTVPVKFKTKKDVQETFSSSAFKSKSHKRQSQIINLVEQRLRAVVKNAKKPKTKKRLKAAHTYAKQRKEASKQKTKRMRT